MVDKPINGFGLNGFKEPPATGATSYSSSSHQVHLPHLDQEALARLEALTSELYHSETGNDRRRQIEDILREFSQSTDSWQVAFVYFERTTNFYTKTFCLYVIEQFVGQRWPSVQVELRTQFRTRLWNYLVEWHHSLSPSTRNKLCTIMATIARFDWPYSYPDFMSNVLDLVTVSGAASVDHLAHSHSSLMQLGLTLLGTTVDELTSPSGQHYHHGSRAELAKLLESHLPPMITALSTQLQVIVSKHINFISATPPPSPSNSPPDAFSTLNKTTDTFGTVFERSIKKNLLTSIPFMDQEMVVMATEVLSCLHKIITFMPSAQCYTILDHSLVSSLFVFASFGAVNPSSEAAGLGLYAMDCINELMSKASRFDTDANDFIFNVFQKIFLILSQVVLKCLKSAERTVPSGDEMDENYLKRFVHFLKLFITGHLGRFEKFITFPITDFLVILLDFTAKVQWHSSECYLLLLDTWMAYLDHLETGLSVKSKVEQSAVAERLQEVQKSIFTLLQVVLASIQYSFSRERLQQLDDHERADEEGRTEFEHFIHHSIEVVAKVAEIYPEETIVYLDSDYLNEKLNALYYGLDFVVNNNNKPLDQMMMKPLNGHKLFPLEMCQQPLGQLQLSIHDFITMLQTFSRFSCFVVDHRFERHVARTKLYFEKFFEILRFVEVHNLCDSSGPLICEFYLLKAQIIATWKAYIVWWQQYCCNVEVVVEPLTTIFNQCCSIICDNLIDETPSVVSSQVKEARQKMFHSAALTLNTFSANVRPQFVFALPSVQRLFDQELQARLLQLTSSSGQVECRVSLTDQIIISQSISNLLILPWTGQETQDWETRSHAFRLFLGNFVQLFNKLEVVDSMPQGLSGRKCPNVYCRSLYILRKVIKSHTNSPLKSKQMVLHALNPSLEAFIQLLLQNNLLYSTRTGCQITSYIVALFVVAFNVLLSQIHIDFVKRTIETLLGIINRQDVNSCTSGPERSVPVVQVFVKFLKLLSLIIKQTSFNPALRSLLPQIIDLTVCRIHATLIDPKSPVSVYFRSSDGVQYEAYHRLLRVYFRFLYELLANNCRYFFPQSHVMSKLSGGGGSGEFSLASVSSLSKGGGEEEPQRYFDSIMAIFGESFLHPEKLELYEQNVEALESLNGTIKLYGRPAFRNEFWHRFLYLFVQSLLDHSLSLFDELLHGTVFHLAEVDFAEFHEQFIPKFVAQVPRLTDAQRLELLNSFKHTDQVNGTTVDQPTFYAKLNRLLCEIRFYHKCNTHI